MKNDTILYVGNFMFPDKNAASQRVLGNANIFKDLGYNVLLVGSDKDAMINDNIFSTKKEAYGFTSYMLPYPAGSKGWINYKQQFFRLKKLIDDLRLTQRICAVIMYGCPSLSLWGGKVRNWSRANNISFLTDCVDWLPVNRGNFIFRTIKWLDTMYQKRYLNAKADGVIAVSKYLTDYYKNRGCNVITLPPLTDTQQPKFQYNIKNVLENKKTKLIYVGTPFALDNKKNIKGRYKDRLDKIIYLLNELRKEGIEFEFNIYGLNSKEYLKSIPEHIEILEDCKYNIIFNGSVSHIEAIKKIQEADFSIFIRDNNKMTMAGFPTKFVESISCGTPVITNKTSDLDKYLVESKNGFWLTINNDQKTLKELKGILKTPKEKIQEMKRECKKSKLFDYRIYKDVVREFLNQIQR